jgi:hypothetical protein
MQSRVNGGIYIPTGDPAEHSRAGDLIFIEYKIEKNDYYE